MSTVAGELTSDFAIQVYLATNKDKVKLLGRANERNRRLLYQLEKHTLSRRCHKIWYSHLQDKINGMLHSVSQLNLLLENGYYAEGWELEKEQSKHPLHPPPSTPCWVNSVDAEIQELAEYLVSTNQTLESEIRLFLLTTGMPVALTIRG